MIGRALLHEWVHARMTKLLMCSLFPVAVGSVLPGCTSAESVTATASAQSVTTTTTSKGKDDATDQSGKNQLDARKEDTANTGNWGYAPGGYYWDPNYKWRRSLGFWDTNSPACPFRYC